MIGLVHPSRGRPEKSYNNVKNWIERAGCEVSVLVSIDFSDPKVKEYEKIYFENPLKNTCLLSSDSNTVVQATNYAAKELSKECNILFYLSDDFRCFDNWAIAIEKEFTNVTTPLVLKIDDALQGFNVRVVTCPIMNKQYYDLMGYFFHPSYDSMFVDCDLYEMALRLGFIKFCRHLIFPHDHVSIGKAQDDDTYKRSAANWNTGMRTFDSRKLKGFPI